MTDIPIKSSINLEEFWQIRANSIEWLYVLDKLSKSVTTQDGRHCMIGVSLDGTSTYLLRKKAYSAATISKATGLSEERLASYAGVITLNQPKSSEGLPEATVEGWGEA